MSSTSARSQNAEKTKPIREKRSVLKDKDLELVAERLSLIQGHLSNMPAGVISGANIINGFLLVALKIQGHELGVFGAMWTIDGKDITQLTEKSIVPLGDSEKTANKV